MTSDNKLLIEISADIKDLQKELKTAQNAVDDFSNKTKKNNEKTAKSFIDLESVASAALGFGIANFAATATVAIRDFAIDSVESALRAEQAMQSFQLVVGDTADVLLNDLRDASRGMVSDLDLVASANRALALGVSQNNLPELLEVARVRSKIMGTTVTQAFNDISIGIGRQSRMILDNLGIVIDLDKSYQNYAETLGKTVEQLTEAEKKEALQQEIIKTNKTLVEAFNTTLTTHADKVQQASASWSNFKTTFGEFSLVAFDVLQSIGAIQNSVHTLDFEGTEQKFQELYFRITPPTELDTEIEDLRRNVLKIGEDARRSGEGIAGMWDNLQKLIEGPMTGETAGSLREQEERNKLDRLQLDLIKSQNDAKRQYGEESLSFDNEITQSLLLQSRLRGEDVTGIVSQITEQENLRKKIEDQQLLVRQIALENKVSFENERKSMLIRNQLEKENYQGLAKTQSQIHQIITTTIGGLQEQEKEQKDLSVQYEIANNKLQRQLDLRNALLGKKQVKIKEEAPNFSSIFTPNLPASASLVTPSNFTPVPAGAAQQSSVVNIVIERLSGMDPDDVADALRTRLGDLVSVS